MKRTKAACFALALAFALLLAACGSGPDAGASSGGDIPQGGGAAGQGNVGKQDEPVEPAVSDGLKVPVGPSIRTLLAGWGSTCAGVLPDGTLIGANEKGPIELPEDWTDIIAVDLREGVLAVVHGDGTVSSIRLKTGETGEREWTDVLDVAVSRNGNVVGLRSDGTVVSDFSTDTRQYSDLIAAELSGWTDIIAVDSGNYNVFGLRSDGTVLATDFYDPYDSNVGQADMADWTDIVAISAGGMHTVGLKADGTVVACGDDFMGQCQVQDWSGIAIIAAGDNQTVGVRTDGTVVVIGSDSDLQKVKGWTDVVAVECDKFTVALFTDGRVENSSAPGYVDTSAWPALRMPDWYK